MRETQQVVLASANPGKLKEMRALLQPLGRACVPVSEWTRESPDETGLTFVENALIKARHACRVSGLPAIGDDSGLCVRALQGAPGLYSSRYAGEGASDAANWQKLLKALEGVKDRSAYFHSTVVFMQHADDPSPIICQGDWEGEIALAPAGSGGFGYDPVFYCPVAGMMSAEMRDKNRVSHRGKALQQLVTVLRGLG